VARKPDLGFLIMDNDLTKHRLEIAEAVLLSLAVLGNRVERVPIYALEWHPDFSPGRCQRPGKGGNAQQMLAEQQRTTDGMIIVHFLDAFVQKSRTSSTST